MKFEDKEELVTILADEALASNAVRVYFSEFVKKSRLSKALKYEAVAKLDDDPSHAAQNLVDWALTKGENPDEYEFTVLGSLLYALLPGLGTEQMQFFMRLFIRYQLLPTGILLETKEFQQHFDQGYNLEYADRQLSEVLEGVTQDLIQPFIEIIETLPDLKVCIQAFLQTFSDPSQISDHCKQEIALIENQSHQLFYRIFVLLKLLLEDYVIPELPVKRVADFAAFLKLVVDDSSGNKIDNWLKTIQKQVGYQPIQVSKKGQKSQSRDAYLMIVIRKAPARSHQFHAAAVLLPEGGIEEVLELGDASQDPHTLKTLPDQVSSFILGAERKLTGLGNFNITVEIFLPIQYWCQAVDCWTIKILSQKVLIGHKYRLCIRSYKRISDVIGMNDYQESAMLRNDLSKTWKELTDFLAMKPGKTEILARIVRIGRENTCFISAFKQQSSEDVDKKLGLRLSGSPPIHRASKRQRKFVFENALLKGYPLMIWSRCEDTADGKLEKTIDGFLDQKALSDFSNLLERIKEKREKDQSSEGLGKHLVILCDNPDRLPTKPLPLTG
jgi:vWA-MoxR associated protein C-terminal domain